MKARAMILAAALSAAAAVVGRAEMKSTVDEWADRFVPEETPKIELPSYADDLDRARAEVTAGKYRAALSTLTKVKDVDPVTLALLKAEALANLGDRKEAAALLASVKSDEATLMSGRLALEDADPAAAYDAARRVLADKPDSIPARLLSAQALEAQGKFKEAIDVYHAFVRDDSYLQKWRADPSQFENADELSDIATAIHRWGTLTMAYRDVPELNDAVLSMFLRAFDVVDRQHVKSRVEAAEFALSRGDQKRASDYLRPAIARAGRDPAVLRMAIQVAMSQGDEGTVRGMIDLFRGNDPDSFDADFWEAVLLARAQQWQQALDRCIAMQSRHANRPEALGLRAALEHINGNEAQLDPLLAEADRLAPGRSDALILAGVILNNAYQKEAAERLFKEALVRTPWEVEARHELGDIYVNEGREDEALAVLNEAYKVDPYQLKTVNYIRLLEEMAAYQKVQTDNYIIYFDADADPIVAQQMGPFMEQVYRDVTEVFQYRPKQKVIVQVYPNDDEFSVRMAGVPGIENFGVSFGRVLATVAPRKGTRQGNFNWARVLKHEFVHTINLLQTNHRTPRWLTEGLAVWQEGVPFRFKDVPKELYDRTMKDELFTVRGLAMAFVRPKKPTDGEQAYTQGAYLAKYMDATFGRDSIVKLLNAYAVSKSDEDAFLAATGKPLEEVERGWHAWMKERLKSWGYDKESTEKVDALIKEGEMAQKARLWEQARKAFSDAYALQPYNLTVNQRLALVYLQKETSDPAKAIEHLKFLHILELQNNRIAKQVARLYLKLDDLPNALQWAREATYVDLYDASAHELIADIAGKLNDAPTADLARQTAEQIKLWELKRKEPATQPATN
jgi:tetratricopeptide (TPR) repeat protein